MRRQYEVATEVNQMTGKARYRVVESVDEERVLRLAGSSTYRSKKRAQRMANRLNRRGAWERQEESERPDPDQGFHFEGNEFYEDDENPARIELAWERGEKGETKKPLPDRDDLCDDVEELLSYCESDYFREKWSLPEKAEAIRANIRASRSRDEMNIDAAEGALHHAVFDLDAQTPQEAVARILDAAFGKVAHE